MRPGAGRADDQVDAIDVAAHVARRSDAPARAFACGPCH